MTINFKNTFPESPTNPARCYVPTGDIEINLERWRQLTPAEREFVLRHEEGHFAQQTFDETEADDYALQQMALKKPYSLQNHIESVKRISYCNPRRVRNAQLQALRVAASDGSIEAKKLLTQRASAAADGDFYDHIDTAEQQKTNIKWIVCFALVAIAITLFELIQTLKH